jgi:Lrp/AsnC family leucine-responsive transcriptional regulator
MKGLDETERRIIHELEKDGKLSFRELGEKLGISKRMAEYYLKKLIRKKAIVSFVAIVDYSKLGFVNHEVWIQTGKVDQEKEERFLRYLVAHPRVGWVASCGGKFDYVISIMAENTVTFSDILRQIISENPGIFANYVITIGTKIRTYPRTYLLGKKNEEREGSLFFSGPPKAVELDKKDLAILAVLSSNAKTSALDLAKKIGMSGNSVRMRVKNLEQMGVIQGYKAIFQPSVIGNQNYELLFTTAGMSAENETEMDNYCRSNPYITLFISCIGRWDINLAVDVRDQQHFQKIIGEIRSRFGPMIKDFEYVPILHIHKFNLLSG